MDCLLSNVRRECVSADGAFIRGGMFKTVGSGVWGRGEGFLKNKK